MHAYNEECLKLLAKYFVNIDTIISKKLLRRVPSYEITLTDELLANLDEESIIRENPSFLIWLRAEIERLNNTYIDEIHSKSPDQSKNYHLLRRKVSHMSEHFSS